MAEGSPRINSQKSDTELYDAHLLFDPDVKPAAERYRS